MGSEQIRRWESGALAHAVNDPFGQGPLPWLRGGETYFGDTGQVVPWYVDADDTDTDAGPDSLPRSHRSAARLPGQRGPRVPAPRS
ncbi:phosphoribosylamine--glycine ligase, partial [Streptomyces sp. NPDC056290]